ncbi:hypothetical protein PRIPAC_73776 [Pristionchus pacificus]|uniref:Endonuclease/exonuclease/phosphatase domain-containing protein n=1 Tax=Pristionchus pacificus TaxID=54126 RepID=A0A2A6CFT8_PRIPA|nr:hypothetical protein PRIPAC_73776 [Pristionchus pacificus]|eukprot:PDM77105.1 hypothetical protein PRIPAC_43017 [Pristionchus pacificus]
MCNGRPSRTPSPDTEGNQTSHLATTAPTLRPSPPRPLPARLRCRSVQRGQGRPITEQLRTSTRTPDRSPTPRHDRDLRICTLNCRSLSSDASIAALEHSFEGIRYDVVCLQETKASKTQELTLTNGARLILGPKVEKKNIGGVGFLIHPRLVSSILSFSILSPRLAVLRIRLGRSSLSLLSIYAPTSAAPLEERQAFFEEVTSAYDREKSHFYRVMAVEDGCFRMIRLDEKIEKSWRYSRRHLPRPIIDPTPYENDIKSYGWTTDPDPSKDYALFCTGLKECARAAEVPPVPPPPRISDRARFWIQERGRCHRDPTSTPFQKIMASRCCRAFLKEDINEHRIRVLMKAAEEKRSIKKAK